MIGALPLLAYIIGPPIERAMRTWHFLSSLVALASHRRMRVRARVRRVHETPTLGQRENPGWKKWGKGGRKKGNTIATRDQTRIGHCPIPLCYNAVVGPNHHQTTSPIIFSFYFSFYWKNSATPNTNISFRAPVLALGKGK